MGILQHWPSFEWHVHFVNTILENITYFSCQQGHIDWQKNYAYMLDDFLHLFGTKIFKTP